MNDPLIRSFLTSLVASTLGLPSAMAQTTERVSVNSGGHQGNGNTYSSCIASNGRIVAFYSSATNLVPGETNGVGDVFVHDRQAGLITRVSVDSGGTQGDNWSSAPCNSSGGRFVAFDSYASNLVPGDTNNTTDMFVHDRQTGQTTRVSVDSAGLEANRNSNESSVSAEGRWVAFHSSASNLLQGDTNIHEDVFVRDRGPAGPSLALTGFCPGAITLTMSNATAHGKLAIACGAAGNFARSTPPCAGVLLGVTPPAQKAILDAESSGAAILSLNASAGLCGRSVQAADVTTCVATSAIVL